MQIKDLIPWGRKDVEAPRRREEGESPILALQRDINRVFDDFWKRFETPLATQGMFGVTDPRADVIETEKGIEVSMELPGMDEKDIDVSLSEDVLTVKGEKKIDREEKKKGYYRSERSYGSFYRTIPLPAGIATDDAKAEFKKGVLTITLPKTPEAQARTKKIEVKPG